MDHLVAQTRELECTKEVLPSVINDLGMITTNNNNSNALCIIQIFYSYWLTKAPWQNVLEYPTGNILHATCLLHAIFN